MKTLYMPVKGVEAAAEMLFHIADRRGEHEHVYPRGSVSLEHVLNFIKDLLWLSSCEPEQEVAGYLLDSLRTQLIKAPGDQLRRLGPPTVGFVHL